MFIPRWSRRMFHLSEIRRELWICLWKFETEKRHERWIFYRKLSIPAVVQKGLQFPNQGPISGREICRRRRLSDHPSRLWLKRFDSASDFVSIGSPETAQIQSQSSHLCLLESESSNCCSTHSAEASTCVFSDCSDSRRREMGATHWRFGVLEKICGCVDCCEPFVGFWVGLSQFLLVFP